MTWPEELQVMLEQAHGDVAVFLALVALRRVENGGAGREFGVLSEEAPTYQAQAHIAAVSIRHRAAAFGAGAIPPPLALRNADGTFTADFLTAFSHHWAPLGADNDPHGLNANHAANLRAFYNRYAGDLLTACRALPGPDATPVAHG